MSRSTRSWRLVQRPFHRQYILTDWHSGHCLHGFLTTGHPGKKRKAETGCPNPNRTPCQPMANRSLPKNIYCGSSLYLYNFQPIIIVIILVIHSSVPPSTTISPNPEKLIRPTIPSRLPKSLIFQHEPRALLVRTPIRHLILRASAASDSRRRRRRIASGVVGLIVVILSPLLLLLLK